MGTQQDFPATLNLVGLPKRDRDMVALLVIAMNKFVPVQGDEDTTPWTPDDVLFCALGRGLNVLRDTYLKDQS